MTRRPIVCGVDLGSTNLKVVAVDESGAVVGRGHQPTRRSEGDGAVDVRRLTATVEDLIMSVCGDRFAVAAVAIAGVGEDGVLVDDRLTPLTTALPWFHPVRQRVLADLRAEYGEVLLDAPDLPVRTDPARTLVGWSWARRQAVHASHWIALTDYVPCAWLGRPFMSDTLAARTAAWLPGPRAWAHGRVLATLGDQGLLPPVVPSGTALGPLLSSRLREAGVLDAEALVVAGGHDHPVGGWAVNRLQPGAVLDSMGTAEVLTTQSSQPDVARTATIDVAPGIRGTGTTLLTVLELDRNVAWARRDEAVSDALTALIAGDLEPSAALEGFLPGTSGGGKPGYTADIPVGAHDRASVVLATLARLGATATAGLVAPGQHPQCVFAAGGWSRSPGWMRIKRAHTPYPLEALPESEVTGVGAALLAAEAIGWRPSAGTALGRAEKRQ